MEREIQLTGIGGQGIQLAAKTLAYAAIEDGREALVFGQYGGYMRGGPTESTVVLAQGPVLSPPVLDEIWAAIAMHHGFWEPVRDRLRPDGFVVVDTSVFRGDLGAGSCTVVELPASDMAGSLGNTMAGSMVALGAFAAATGIVSLASLITATGQVLPSYRAQHAKRNAEAVQLGYDHVAGQLVSAWPDRQEALA